MESRFIFEVNPPLILWEVYGVATAEELLQDYNDLFQHPEWNPKLNVLVSFTENSELYKLDKETLTWFAAESENLDTEYRQGIEIKTAIISHSHVQAPIIQLWQYMVEEQLMTNDRYFDNEATARAWLAENTDSEITDNK